MHYAIAQGTPFANSDAYRNIEKGAAFSILPARTGQLEAPESWLRLVDWRRRDGKAHGEQATLA